MIFNKCLIKDELKLQQKKLLLKVFKLKFSTEHPGCHFLSTHFTKK